MFLKTGASLFLSLCCAASALAVESKRLHCQVAQTDSLKEFLLDFDNGQATVSESDQLFRAPMEASPDLSSIRIYFAPPLEPINWNSPEYRDRCFAPGGPRLTVDLRATDAGYVGEWTRAMTIDRNPKPECATAPIPNPMPYFARLQCGFLETP